MLSRLYGALAGRRRRWYASRSDRRRKLEQPVISVGALAVGGSGKTPVAALVSRILVSMGEHPAILSRGYGRQRLAEGVVVVSERGMLRAGVDVSGDEPLMLARQLPDVSVVVAEDRYLAGRLAETRLGATVHLLDDGFQHVALERALDIVLLRAGDLEDPRPLPTGHLRESLSAAVHADVLLADTDDSVQARMIGDRVGLQDVFRFARQLHTPYEAATSHEVQLARGAKILAVAGIARPRLFSDTLSSVGYDVVESMSFGDHHAFSRSDIAAIEARARALSVAAVLTTEKDLERLLPHSPLPFRLLAVPVRVSVEPADQFRARLSASLAAARAEPADLTA